MQLKPKAPASNEAIDIGTEKDERDEDEAGVLEGFRRRVLRNGAGEAVTFITIDCLLCKATLRTKKGLIVQHFGSSTLAVTSILLNVKMLCFNCIHTEFVGHVVLWCLMAAGPACLQVIRVAKVLLFGWKTQSEQS